MREDPAFRQGAAWGLGTGFLAASVLFLLVVGLGFGMFSAQRWYLLTPAVFFLGFGRRGFWRGLLLSLLITLSLNAVFWAFSHGVNR